MHASRIYGINVILRQDSVYFVFHNSSEPFYTLSKEYIKRGRDGHWYVYHAQASEIITAVKLLRAFS
jgi:hypothetical protein